MVVHSPQSSVLCSLSTVHCPLTWLGPKSVQSSVLSPPCTLHCADQGPRFTHYTHLNYNGLSCTYWSSLHYTALWPVLLHRTEPDKVWKMVFYIRHKIFRPPQFMEGQSSDAKVHSALSTKPSQAFTKPPLFHTFGLDCCWWSQGLFVSQDKLSDE